MTILCKSLGALAGALLISLPFAEAAVFPSGTSDGARIEVTDSTGGLSWNDSTGTVACWVKISIPAGVSLTENMTILANRRTGDWSQPYAYRIYFNIDTGNIEFMARGASGALSNPIVLVQHPYLDRWYHLAVERSKDQFLPYLDGRQLPPVSQSIGDSKNTDGISIGGFQSGERFWGEIQEITIYQSALFRKNIVANMLQDIPPDFLTMRGYFKLGYSSTTGDNLKNFATAAPTGTETGLKQGSGTIDFPETDRQGEQSVFDSRKNQGQNAIASLSGGYSWNQTVLTRPTPGIPFQFAFGYSSGIGFSGQQGEGGLDIYAEDNVLSKGWRHSFQTALVAGDLFLSSSSVGTYVGLLSWDGNLDTWQRQSGGVYKTTHGEYRGELRDIGGGDFVEWTTPDRLVYKFYHPANSTIPLLNGKLAEIRDFNGNHITLDYDATGRLKAVHDTAGGTWNFTYNPQNLLASVTGPNDAAKWTITFTYDAQNRLITKSIAGPAAYESLASQWQFSYSSGTPAGLLESIIDPRGKNDTRIAYDQYGRKTTVKDANNRTAQFEYNKPALRQLTTTALDGGDGSKNRAVIDTFDRKLHLLSTRDPLGFTTTNEYDAAGNVTATMDPRGNRTAMTYDARSNTLSTTDALGETTQWEYKRTLPDGTGLNKPTKSVDPLNWATTYTYDDAGNLVTQADNLGPLVNYTYDSRGLVSSGKDANGNETQFTYWPEGFLKSKTIAAGSAKSGTWNYTRSELGWLLTESNPLGRTSSSSYNINGQVTRLTDPLGRTFTKTYDPNGNLTSESDGKGQATGYDYDDADQQVRRTDRGGGVWNMGYSPFGELVSTTAPAAISEGSMQSDTVTRTFDNAGRLLRETDPKGDSVSYEYDPNDNQTATIDKLGKRWEKSFDALNRVVATRDPDGNVSGTRFDRAGRIKVLTSANGFPSTHDYDGRGRLVAWTDPEGFVWTYTYDGVGNILDIKDALGGHYTMSYGPRNERLTEKNQDKQTWNYEYDVLARLSKQTDPNGTQRTLDYDDASRLVSVSFNTGRTNTIGYDDNNNVVSVTRAQPGAPATSLQLGYDSLDRLTSSTDTFSKTVRYGYDALSRVTTKLYPGGKALAHGYDRLGRLTSLSFSGGSTPPLACTFTWDKAGRMTGRTYPTGITQTNGFDQAGRLTGLEYKQGGNSLVAFTYAYDRNGNKTGGNDTGTLGWKDDALPNYDETTSFTAAGKLVTRTDTGGKFVKAFKYDYDASGNMVHASAPGEDYRLTYDEDNRTTAIQWDVGLTSKDIVNRYDGLGRGVSRKIDGVDTRYVLDLTGNMERILCDTDATGTIKAWYVHGPDLCFKVDNTDAVTCYHADAMGNIVRTTDKSAATISEYAYTPYGRMLASKGTAENPYRFVGSQGVMEELPGLYFMRARYYSADVGTFLSTDPNKPIGPGWQPESYAYSSGNPLRYIDANGNLSREAQIKVSEGQTQALFWQSEADYWNGVADFLEPVNTSLDILRDLYTADLKGAGLSLVELSGQALSAYGFKTAGKVTTGIGELGGLISSAASFKPRKLVEDTEFVGKDISKYGFSVSRIGSLDADGWKGAKYLNSAGGIIKTTQKTMDALQSSSNAKQKSGSSTTTAGAASYAGSLNISQASRPISAVTANSTASTISKSSGGGSVKAAVTSAISAAKSTVTSLAKTAVSAVQSAAAKIGSIFKSIFKR